MAGDWIKVEHVTPDKPEVHEMAEMLGIDPDAVFGKLMRIWIWADQQTYDGNESGHARSVTLALLNRDTSVTGFAQAMQKVGWLAQHPEEKGGGYYFPNFTRHNGQTAKARALATNRQKKKRGEKVSRKCHAPSVTSSSLLFSSLIPSFSSLPEELKTQEFLSCLQDWERHRREIKKPLTRTQAEKQLRQFSEWGAERSRRAIEHTIAMGWQGLREPEQKRAADLKHLSPKDRAAELLKRIEERNGKAAN